MVILISTHTDRTNLLILITLHIETHSLFQNTEPVGNPGVHSGVIFALGSYLLGMDLSLTAILLRVVTTLADIGLWLTSKFLSE